MKVHLMFKDRDVDPEQQLPVGRDEVMQDLDIPTLLQAMAGDDDFLLDVCRHALLSSLREPEEIVYRQAVLEDCLSTPDLIRQMYGIAAGAIDAERKVFYGFFKDRPAQLLHRSVTVLELFLDPLKQLRAIADENVAAFTSPGLKQLLSTLQVELDDPYFDEVAEHLRQLKFRRGLLMSARLGAGNLGADYVLRTPGRTKQSWKQWLGLEARDSYSFEIPARDEAGATALDELRDRGLDPVANALAQSTDHILSFFKMLRAELGFYIGCMSLREKLADLDADVCIPVPVPWKPDRLKTSSLYDVSLALRSGTPVVGNDVDADDVSLIIITGANSGGKSTFLRSIGLAQLMMQCGMFVPAASFTASATDALFTHFIREEDASMSRGRLDDELSRMNAIAMGLTPRSMVLFNESFAATNEREGSEIARQILNALTEQGIKALFVTHLFDLADGFRRSGRVGTLYLRAEREIDGKRSFQLREAPPLSTSFGQDLYERLGAWDRKPPGENTEQTADMAAP